MATPAAPRPRVSERSCAAARELQRNRRMPCLPFRASCLLALAAGGSLLAAELPAQPLDHFTGLRLSVGQLVRVTGPQGHRTTGTIVRLEERLLMLRLGDRNEYTVQAGDVEELAVQRRYGWQGAAIGAAVGLGLTLIDCRSNPDTPCDPDLPILLGASIGGLFGQAFKRYDVRFTLVGRGMTGR